MNPISLKVSDEYHRAAPGGSGGVKAIGNYAPGMMPSKKAKADGYAEIIYLDAVNHRYEPLLNGTTCHSHEVSLAHKKYRSLVESNGGFVTDFWSTSKFDPSNFLRRNRLIAGLSAATIVIESGVKGGSLITAQFAFDYNREVFALPGRINDLQSVGCHNLIKTKNAHLLSTPADIPYILNWNLETEEKPIQKKLFIHLEPDEQAVYDYLKKEGKTLLDLIALNCKIPTSKAAYLLLNLELKGAVRPLPGKEFELI